MKKFLSVLLTIVMILSVLSPSVFADDGGAESGSSVFYVDNVLGDDKNDGLSKETAFKSLEKVKELKLKPGDTLLIKGGQTYNENWCVSATGTAEKPILISSYGESRPVMTADSDYVLKIKNSSYLTVENMQFTDADMGIQLYACDDYISENVTIRNITFNNIHNQTVSSRCGGYPCIFLGNDRINARLVNTKVNNIRIENCGWGIVTDGVTREWSKDQFVSEEESYNRNIRISNVTMKKVLYDGMILRSLYDSTVSACRLINVATRSDYPTAPLWMHHCDHVTVEWCEIAGSANTVDGMAIDFDGWTTNSVYQYIYSHDNRRFMRNCVYDSETRNRNNTVRFCLSVDDNAAMNYAASMYVSTNLPSLSSMEGFTFCNNVLLNCSAFSWAGLSNAVIANNIFFGKSFNLIISFFVNLFSFSTRQMLGNSYRRYAVPINSEGSIFDSKIPTLEEIEELIDYYFQQNSFFNNIGFTE